MDFWADFLGMLGDLALAMPSGQPPLAKNIEAARSKQWVLLVMAPTPSSKQPTFQEQKKLLGAAVAGLRERDVLVIYRLHGELLPHEEMYLHQHYGLRLKYFEFVLIGREGTVKLRSTHLLEPEALFDNIDRMSAST